MSETPGWQHLITLDVDGFPATFATAREAEWKRVVTAACERWAATTPPRVTAAFRYAVEIDFRLGPSRHAGETWDLDNLIKPTLDAMIPVFGPRQWSGPLQPQDDLVDRLQAEKRQPADGEQPGATITVHVRPATQLGTPG
ncbi:hypothetical protein [Puerhibacterium sp. TATVAM-FAB25]|uniref:hypothetical protein n=1 Tax=Puerhibacterium sp. TATVAM-FAB25 TaxID=3093699 RepID=UPI003978080E